MQNHYLYHIEKSKVIRTSVSDYREDNGFFNIRFTE